VTAFTRDVACGDCGRQYLVSGALSNLRSETETLTQFRCACGQWMGAFVPASARVEELVVSLKPATAGRALPDPTYTR
jgi:hypothetical protein